MKITKESTGNLTATIRLEIDPADYQEVVSKKMKEYQRKANVSGFRPGKVPFGMIKKMYGKAVIADEINTLLSQNLASYLKDEKLNILGNPLANKEKIHQAKFEDGESFDFYFDIGLAPEINLELGPELEVQNCFIRVDDKMVDGYIEDTRKRNGTYTHPETAGSEDLIAVDATELGADGNPVEGGLQKNIFLYLDKITDEKIRKKLMDIRKDELLVIRPTEFFGSVEETAKQLNLPAKMFDNPDFTLSLKCTDITHIEPAELHPEFFAKVYPGEEIETEEDFREQVRKDAAASFTGETDKLLFQEVTDLLADKSEVQLPDQFLKRWMLEHDENKLSEEEIEKQYPSFARSMKWQLIENKLIKDYQIEVKDEEIRSYIRTYLLRQVNPEFVDPEMAKKYETIMETFMQNKEKVQKINDQLFNAKLLGLFKEKLTLNPAEVSYEQFINLVSSKHEHEYEHDHEH
ncbi:MAG: trigger factor [bacterium]